MYDIKEIGMIPPPYGGVSVYLRRLIDKLDADEFSVGGYYTCSSNDKISHSPLFDRWSWFESYKFPLKIFKYIFQLNKYKILHSHLSLEAMLYLWTLKKILNKKIIVTVHNSMVENYYKHTNRLNAYFLRRMANDQDVVWIAVSQEGKNQMENLPFTFKSDIQVIPAYIPESINNKLLPHELEVYLAQYNRSLAFYGHSLMLNDGMDVYGYKQMLDIYKHVLGVSPDIGLVYCMADISNGDGIRDIEEYAHKLGIYDKIFWQYGSLSSLQPLWEKIDVYVRPTSTDGDSLAVREALEAGARVVTTDVVKRPTNCAVYHYGDINEASNKIFSVLKEDRIHVSRDFSQYEKMKKIYIQLLENKSL